MATSIIPANPQTPQHGTTIGPMSAGCYGFITSGGNQLNLFFPMALYSKENIDIKQTGSLSRCVLQVRHVAGGYVIGSEADALSSCTLATCVLLSYGRGLQIVLEKSNGFGVTNNTPVAGIASITINF